MEIKIIKTFRDGSVMVESEGKSAVMDMAEFERLRMRGFDLKKEILTRLKKKFPHCSFDIKEENSRDFVYMNDNISLTNLSIGGLEFWINDQRMNFDDVNSYVDDKIMPSIVTAAYKVEYELCKESPEYFMKHYCIIRNKA